MFSFKGRSFISVSILCIVLFAAALVVATSDPAIISSDTPVVLNANEVPAAGGLLFIYGVNLGNDENDISVDIVDYTRDNVVDSTFPCLNVSVVLANVIISCHVTLIGTGRAKHISVTVNGISNNVDSPNTFFNRHAPNLHTVTFYTEQSILLISGNNFGTDAGVVSVLLDGTESPILSVNDSFITCSRPSDFDPSASVVAVVVVDGQGSAENMTVLVDSSIIDESRISASAGEEGTDGGASGTSNWFTRNLSEVQIKMLWIALAAVGGLVAISVIVAFAVIRRKRSRYELEKAASATIAAFSEGGNTPKTTKKNTTTTKPTTTSTTTTTKHGKPGKAVPVSRDESIVVEIDEAESCPSIYDDDENDDSLSSSSSSSTGSSYSTPAGSPFPSPAAAPRAHSQPRGASVVTSHANDSETPSAADAPMVPQHSKFRRMSVNAPSPLGRYVHKSTFSMTPPLRRSKKSHHLRVPSSRIEDVVANDAPYFAKQGAFAPKQGAFDSPGALDSPAADSPARTLDSPARALASPARALDSPKRSVDSPIHSAAASPKRSVDSPIQSALTRSMDSPLHSALASPKCVIDSPAVSPKPLRAHASPRPGRRHSLASSPKV